MAIENLTCPYPENINPLSSNGFMFSVTKLPGLQYFCQQATIPGLSLPSPDVKSPLSTSFMGGDILTYEPLTIQFLVDSNMDNYVAIHNWLVGVGFPETWDQFTQFVATDTSGLQNENAKTYSDGTLTILNNSFVPIRTIQFIDLIPTSLDALTFQATNSDVTYLVGNVTFNYFLYKFV